MEFIGNLNNNFLLDLYHLNIDNDILSKEILNFPKKVSNNTLNTFFEDTLFNKELGNESSKFINTIETFALKNNYHLALIWSHIHQHLESTNTHQHIPFYLSFVYYVKTPINCGKFIIDFTLINGPRIPISPVEGNLLLFPSWLPHMVTKNLSNDVRISISGNFNLKQEN